MKNEVKQLSHSSYRCEYHIVFAPKYRRKNNIWGDKGRYRGNTAKTMPREKGGNNRSRSMRGSYTYASEYSTVS